MTSKKEMPTVFVGQGVTKHGWSQSYAHTVVAVSPSGKTLTLQRDKAVRSNRETDIVTAGGFCAHTEHPDGQQWDITPNPHGQIIKARWSRAKGNFYSHGAKVSVHYHAEYYDYNF